MSFEETLICDGCSSVLGGGPRRNTVAELLSDGGAAFVLDDRRRRIYARIGGQDATLRSSRHLCARCSGATVFFDGVSVPRLQDGEQ